ncbi:MAG: hypothetical protein CMO55_06210 [Verrucomicrobiales bacterium]|nr:hypothetical protein [Verrucomicrobiales bacterium]
MKNKPINEVIDFARDFDSEAPEGLTESILARLEESPFVRRTLIAAAITAGITTILISGLVSRQIATNVASERPPVQQLFTPGGGLINAS